MSVARAGSIKDLENTTRFRSLSYYRNLCLAFNVGIPLVLAILVMALHVEPVTIQNTPTFLGYHVHFAFDRWQTYFWLGIFAIGSIWYINDQAHKQISMPNVTEIFPNDYSNGCQFGCCDAKTIVAMTTQLAAKMEIPNIAKILVADTPDANAYTARIFGVGNIVVLYRNLLEIVPQPCVEAIIAHELGHVRSDDSFHRQLANFPKQFLFALGCVLAWKVSGGLLLFTDPWDLSLKIFFISLVVAGMSFAIGLVQLFDNLASRQMEYIADAYASWACGMEPMFNSLLLLGERGEAVLALRLHLDGHPVLGAASLDESSLFLMLERVSRIKLDEEFAGKIARLLYIETQFCRLRDRLLLPLNDQQVFDFAKEADAAWVNKQIEANQAMEQERATETPAQREIREKTEAENIRKWEEAEKLLVKWRSYDTDSSGHLDRNECAAFIAELKADEKRLLFRQFSGQSADQQSHPTIRQRLLCIYSSFSDA